MSFIQGGTIHGLGGDALPHNQWSTLPEGFWFQRTLEEATQK